MFKTIAAVGDLVRGKKAIDYFYDEPRNCVY